MSQKNDKPTRQRRRILPKEPVRLSEAARFLGISDTTFYKWIENDWIPLLEEKPRFKRDGNNTDVCMQQMRSVKDQMDQAARLSTDPDKDTASHPELIANGYSKDIAHSLLGTNGRPLRGADGNPIEVFKEPRMAGGKAILVNVVQLADAESLIIERESGLLIDPKTGKPDLEYMGIGEVAEHFGVRKSKVRYDIKKKLIQKRTGLARTWRDRRIRLRKFTLCRIKDCRDLYEPKPVGRRQGRSTVAELADKYKVPENTVKGWRPRNRRGRNNAMAYLGRSIDVEDETFEEKITRRLRNGKEIEYTRTVTRETFLDAEIERIVKLKASGFRPTKPVRGKGRFAGNARNTPPSWPDDPKAAKQNEEDTPTTTPEEPTDAKGKRNRGGRPLSQTGESVRAMCYELHQEGNLTLAGIKSKVNRTIGQGKTILRNKSHVTTKAKQHAKAHGLPFQPRK